MGTTIKHPVPDRVKLSFVIFLTSGHSDAQPWAEHLFDQCFIQALFGGKIPPQESKIPPQEKFQ